MNERVQIRINGCVQGVGYRYFAVHVARQMGINGTVRNTADGGVEVNAEGNKSAIAEFMMELRRGPHSAEVTDLTTAWSEATGEFDDFRIV